MLVHDHDARADDLKLDPQQLQAAYGEIIKPVSDCSKWKLVSVYHCCQCIKC